MRGFRFRFRKNSVPIVIIVDEVNIVQKQTIMSKIGSSGIKDSDGSKAFVEYNNRDLLHWFIVLRQRSHVRPRQGARVQ